MGKADREVTVVTKMTITVLFPLILIASSRFAENKGGLKVKTALKMTPNERRRTAEMQAASKSPKSPKSPKSHSKPVDNLPTSAPITAAAELEKDLERNRHDKDSDKP